MDSRVRRSRAHALRACAVAACVILCVCAGVLSTGEAYGYPEPSGEAWPNCYSACHQSGDCVSCHAIYPIDSTWYEGNPDDWFSGPHGSYTASSTKCATCHSVHKSPADSILLLPAATIVETCETCHDGTGGYGVYGAVFARTGVDPKVDVDVSGSHRIGVTNTTPGGSPMSGGSLDRVFRGSEAQLICSDCHSVHGSDVVNAFVGDRRRVRAPSPSVYSSKLLRRTPGDSSVAVDDYGSDWCLGCHEGRVSSDTLHNHPVESADSEWHDPADPLWVYGNLPILSSDAPVATTVLSGLGGIVKTDSPFFMHAPDPPYASENRGYLMPYPRTADQVGRAPICQQCHEDTRFVGTLVELSPGVYGGDAADAKIAIDSADGFISTDNPQFQNFPHETLNDRMLVEEDDDLCLNCHPMAQLP